MRWMTGFVLIYSLLTGFLWGQDDAPITFTDANLEALLLEAEWRKYGDTFHIDANHDGVITVAEALAVDGSLIIFGEDLDNREVRLSVMDLNHFSAAEGIVFEQVKLKDLAALNLPQVEGIFFYGCDLDVFAQGDYPRLRSLELHESSFATLSLASLADLERITVSRSTLTTLNLTDLPNLMSLSCEQNQLQQVSALPSSVFYLNLRQNQLASLPELPSDLSHLHVADNQLSALPTLPSSLGALSAGNNQLQSLPEMAMLQQLRFLGVNGNQLTSLPQLPEGLVELYAAENQIQTMVNVPASLTRINLAHNQLQSLPEFPMLQAEINLSHNALSQFPDFGAAQNIHLLDLSHNQIQSLPDLSIFNSHMDLFNLSHNLIEEVTEPLPPLVRNLNFAYNHLVRLESDFPHIIQSLNLGGNPISLEGNYRQWFNVPTLFLAGGIDVYPDFAGEGFERIETLWLQQANLTELPTLPTNLRNLAVSDNPLGSLPNLATATPSLRSLWADSCELQSLPDLPRSLIDLQVAYNRLTNVDALFTLVTWQGSIRLRKLDLRGNFLNEAACLPLELVPYYSLVEVEPQAHDQPIDCEWIHQPIDDFNPLLQQALIEGAELFYYRDAPDFSDPKMLTPANLLRVRRLDVSQLGAPDGVVDLSGLAHLKALQELDLKGIGIADFGLLGELNNLRELDLSLTGMTVLPELPDTLEGLRVDHNPLVQLNALPLNLKSLRANHTLLAQLPATLPTGLTHLEVQSSLLTSLPALPTGLVTLKVSANPLGSLPPLPQSLKHLYCHSIGLTVLPELPESLIILYAQNNALQFVPALPSSMKTLVLSQNLIGEIGDIRVRNEVYLDHNLLTQVPNIAFSSKDVRLDHNPIQDWSGLKAWRDVRNLDASFTGLLSVEPFLVNERLFSSGIGSLNVEGNLLNDADCDDLNALLRLFSLELVYQQQQATILDCVDYGQVVAFADAELEAYLLQYRISYEPVVYLDRNRDGVINEVEAAAVQRLYLWDGNYQYTDLSGIEAFVNAEEISIQQQQGLVEIPDLTSFSKLYHLSLADLPELQQLGDLPDGLKKLFLYEVALEQLPALPEQLEVLDCFDGALVSLPTLPQGLRELGLSQNALQALPTIPPNVETLYAAYNQIQEMPEFEGNRLRELDLSHNQIRTLTPLKGFQELIRMELDHNLIETIPVMQDLPQLVVVELSDNRIQDAALMIDGLTSLLEVNGMSVVDIQDNLLDLNACIYLSPLLLSLENTRRLVYRRQQEFDLSCH